MQMHKKKPKNSKQNQFHRKSIASFQDLSIEDQMLLSKWILKKKNLHALVFFRKTKQLWLLTSNCQVTEEEPPTDQWLLRVAGWFVHDIEIRRIKAQSSSRETIRHKVHP